MQRCERRRRLFLEAQKTLDQEQRGEEILVEKDQIDKLAKMERVLGKEKKKENDEIIISKDKFNQIINEIERMNIMVREIVDYHKS